MEDNGLGQATKDAIKAAWGERGGELEMDEESSSEDENDDHSSSDNDSSDGSASEI